MAGPIRTSAWWSSTWPRPWGRCGSSIAASSTRWCTRRSTESGAARLASRLAGDAVEHPVGKRLPDAPDDRHLPRHHGVAAPGVDDTREATRGILGADDERHRV